MYTEKSSIKKDIMAPQDAIQLLNIAKIIKANLIVYSKKKKMMIGFNKSFFDDNVLKVFKPIDSTIYNNISKNVPNFAIYTKDLAALNKEYLETHRNIWMEKTNYIKNDNDVLIGIKCKERKDCFDYFKYMDKYEETIDNKHNSLIAHYENIKEIPEFQEAMSHKASEGIIRFKYNDFIYFIYPSMINALKTDVVSLDIYCTTEKETTSLLKYTIHKKKYGNIEVYYRTRILE